MDTLPCLVTWPTDPTAGDLMAGYLRPAHQCRLTAEHVHQAVDVRADARGVKVAVAQAHTCHCGAWTPVVVEEPASRPCPRCDGCGRVGSDDEHAPWTFWEALPPGSDLAVRLGVVVPMTCVECFGTGLVQA